MYDKPNSGTINLFVLQPGTRCLVIARIGGLKGFMCVMLLSDAGEVGWTNRERELQKV